MVVVSALSGVTDGLLALAAGATPDPRASLAALLERHLVAARLVTDETARAVLERELRDIAAHASAVLAASPTPLAAAACDELVAAGELWSSRLLAARLAAEGVRTAWILTSATCSRPTVTTAARRRIPRPLASPPRGWWRLRSVDDAGRRPRRVLAPMRTGERRRSGEGARTIRPQCLARVSTLRRFRFGPMWTAFSPPTRASCRRPGWCRT